MSLTEIKGLIEDSSTFTSEDYQSFLDDLQDKIKKKHKVLSDREQKLMSGIFLKE